MPAPARSLQDAHARHTLRAGALAAICLVAVFGAIAHRGESSTSEHRARDFATGLASSLSDSAGFSLTERIGRLESRLPSFVAAAVIDINGDPYEVVPNRPAHRELVAKFLQAKSPVLASFSPTTGASANFAAGFSPLSSPQTMQHAGLLVVVDIAPHRQSSMGMTVMFAACVVAVVWWWRRSSARWFQRHVAHPLGAMGTVATSEDGYVDWSAMTEAERWYETQAIGEKIEGLGIELAEANANIRRLTQDTKRVIRDRERGFDRKLRQAQDQARTDSLTRLRNRAFLDEELPPVFQQQRDSKEPLSAIMIDLDNFKRYNDKNGHQVGDALLRFVGALLRGSIRPSDVAVRYGGDEFLLLLPGATSAVAAGVAERLVKLFGQYASRLRGREGLSMSAGVASLSDEAFSDGNALIEAADRAMYKAKSAGKNRVGAGARSALPSAVAT
ncbi:MAG: GGDEF domain-containing protein [Planctomycetota bacterium]